MNDITKIKLNKHVDHIISLKDNIILSNITILTGTNGSGKSVIGKTISKRVKEELDGKTKSISMNTRTQNNAAWGALSSSMSDTEWIATSQNTYSLLKGVFNALKEDIEDTKYLILDEFEIGCSLETILALTIFINNNLKELKIGCLIITHSTLAVENLNFDDFINIDGLNLEKWVNRKITPTNLEILDKNELFEIIRDRTKKK